MVLVAQKMRVFGVHFYLINRFFGAPDLIGIIVLAWVALRICFLGCFFFNIYVIGTSN